MFNFRLLKNADFTLWLSVLLLIIIGFLAIYSTTFAMLLKKAVILDKSKIDALIFLKRHLFSLILGLIGMVFFSYVDYKHLKKADLWMYVAMILLLITVFIIGYENYGAQRWVSLGFFSLQPSELAKIAAILILAKYFEAKNGINNILDILPLAVIVGIPFVLIFKQPDLGTALVLIAITAGLIIWANPNVMISLLIFTPILSALFSLSWYIWILYLFIFGTILYLIRIKTFEYLLVFGANISVGLMVPIVWHLLKDYQKQRLFTFLNPSSDPYGAGYHTIQSQIAIGSGGLFGSGYLHGTQTQLQFIPQQWTDFIFSSIGEEFGFMGSFLVIALFMIIIWRAIDIAANSRNPYGSFIAAGIASMYIFHVFVNIGMTLGIAPVVGIPLPFVSFGGTSLIMNLCAIGILQSISMRRIKLFF